MGKRLSNRNNKTYNNLKHQYFNKTSLNSNYANKEKTIEHRYIFD